MRSSRTCLVLQHAACEPAAAYQDELDRRGIPTSVVRLDREEQVPSWDRFAAVVAMGGPMSVNDESGFPWLAEEKRLIGEFVRGGGPFWGVCLGAQLLAASLGARVVEGPSPEVGVLPVRLEEEGRRDPIFSVLPPEFPALQWHNDTFELPQAGVALARSAAYRRQAFRWKRAYGLQFHLEASSDLVAEWAAIPDYADALNEALGPHPLPVLTSQLAEAEGSMRAGAVALFGRWLDIVVAPEGVAGR